MSRVFSFSTDKEFAEELDRLILESGYKNRSMFLRDATIYFSASMKKWRLGPGAGLGASGPWALGPWGLMVLRPRGLRP